MYDTDVFSTEEKYQEYQFSVSYLEKNVYKSHEERKVMLREVDAYRYFRELIQKYNVGGGSYYLCRWGLPWGE